MSADKAPVAKLPLAARKNVRDGFEAKKPELEAKLSTMLGVPWTMEADALAIYPYAEENSYGHSSPGDCIYAYFDNLLWGLKNFLDKHGDSGKDELNSVCTAHIATLSASTKFSYCGCEVVDGKLSLVFHPNNLGSNISHVAEKLDEALSTAPQPEGASPLSYAARHSIKSEYEPKIGALLEKAQKALHNTEFKFDPCFEELGAKFKGNKDVRDDWETNLGSFVWKYFESFVDVLERNKFADDEMLREGLEEAAPKGVLKLRIVDKLNSGYNQILVDDECLVIETTPSNWGTNIHYAGEKLVDIL